MRKENYGDRIWFRYFEVFQTSVIFIEWLKIAWSNWSAKQIIPPKAIEIANSEVEANLNENPPGEKMSLLDSYSNTTVQSE